jgi:hypothetical protein
MKKSYGISTSSDEIIDSDQLNDNYLFDFKNYNSGYRNINNNLVITNNSTTSISDINEYSINPFITNENSEYRTKVKVKPIDILNELETVPSPITLILLDEKIDILKEKNKLIRQSYSKREVSALIERLENRKKYSEFKEFFDQFANTTDEKIAKLLNKYDLVMKTSDIFIPEFPDDAIKIMSAYVSKTQELCQKDPVFYVIATPDKFKDVYEKRDPILLVQSPFGFYWQILGVWDSEMLILSDL